MNWFKRLLARRPPLADGQTVWVVRNDLTVHEAVVIPQRRRRYLIQLQDAQQVMARADDLFTTLQTAQEAREERLAMWCHR